MNFYRKFSLYFISVISVFVIILTLLSLIHDVQYWYLKVLDFPRVQYLSLAIICLILFSLLNQRWRLPSFSIILGLTIAIFIHSTRILPYLIGEKAVPDLVQDINVKKDSVGILIANVLMTNRQSSAFSDIVKNYNPDMLLVMEVDEWWIDELSYLKKKYAYAIEHPLDNAYGMALYSRLPLENIEIKFLNKDSVPSIHAEVVFPSGNSFLFHGLHPVAPVPSSKYPDNQGEKEVALGKIAKIVEKDSLPSVVAGDLNDVSWSNTLKLFENNANLKNVRLGRGVLSTFNAKSTFLRYPLDHFFVSDEFSLITLERLPEFNSDHFPLFCKLALDSPL